MVLRRAVYLDGRRVDERFAIDFSDIDLYLCFERGAFG